MSEFALVPSHMSTASAAASGASAEARKANGRDALVTLAGSLPGTTTAGIMPDLGRAWETGVNDWSDDADAFAASVDATAHDSVSTDGGVGGVIGILRGLVGGR